MPSSTHTPLITSDMVSFVTQETGASAVRARGALKAVGGHVDQAVELLRKIERSRARKPAYGTELSRALGERPGFAEGYRDAQRQVEFGRQLRTAREARGLSQMQLAELAKVDQGDISRFEVGKWGKRGISYEMLDRILPVLGYRLEHQIVPARDAPLAEQAEQMAVYMTGLLSP